MAKPDKRSERPSVMDCDYSWSRQEEGTFHSFHKCSKKQTYFNAHTVHRCSCGSFEDENNPR